MTEAGEHKALTLAFGDQGIVAGNVGEALEICKMISASGLIPAYSGNPGAILVAMEMGRELGYPVMKMLAMLTAPPKSYRDKSGAVKVADLIVALDMGNRLGLDGFQALQGIAVINGTPKLWGDAMLALVLRHDEYQDHTEWLDSEGAHCTIVRKGREPKTQSFSWDKAKRAGLISKPGPWQQYPERMLQMRARSWALRDRFADALLGVGMAEEARDVVEMDAPEYVETQVEMGRKSVRAPKPKPTPMVTVETPPDSPPDGAESRSEPGPALDAPPAPKPAQNATGEEFKLNPGEAELRGMASKAETMSDCDLLVDELSKRRVRKAARPLIVAAIDKRRAELQIEGKDEPGADG